MLRSFEFSIVDGSVPEDRRKIIISEDVVFANRKAGEIELIKDNPPSYGHPVVVYNCSDGVVNVSSINGSLDLRDALELNGVVYDERPPRSEVVSALRESAKRNLSLADRIEGK